MFVARSRQCGAPAQTPRVLNATFETRPVTGPLDAAIRSVNTGWAGYAVPRTPGRGSACWWEDRGDDRPRLPATNPPFPLEARNTLIVLFRLEAGQIERIRTFTPDCEVDAGGLPFLWLTAVSPTASLELLAAQSEARSRTVISTIAQHAADAANRLLLTYLAPSQPDQVRRQAAFWFPAARGRAGFDKALELLRTETSDNIRERVIQGLGENHEPQAVDTLENAARQDKSARVRGQAMFVLARKSPQRALPVLRDAIDNDPDQHAKTQAVHALRQLPGNEGTPLLIQTAKSTRNSAVRRAAMQALGQSRDPRATAFLEELLRK